MGIDLRHMRCFVAVAEELHFRRAAEKIGIAQPALSRTIHNLEKELGVTLLNRSNRVMQITTAGQTFLQGCHSALSGVKHTIDDTRRVHLGKIGALRIGYTDNAIGGQVPDLLKRFQIAQPDIDLRLSHAVTATQLHQLQENALDFGFVTGPISRSGFAQLPVQSERFVCVVYKEHKLASRSVIALNELAQEDFVHGSSKDWEFYYSYLIPLCRKVGFEPRIVQEGLNTAAILGLVACGMGITILTDCVRNAAGPDLVVIPLHDVTDTLNTVAVWKKDRVNGAKDHFVSFLSAAENKSQE